MRNPRVWNYQELLQRRSPRRLLGWLAWWHSLFLALVVVRVLYLHWSGSGTVALGKTEGRCISSC